MIHKYKMNGYNIVLDVNSGSVHVLDNIAFNILDLFLNNTKEEIINILKHNFLEEEILEAYNELENLQNEKTLFSKDVYENILDLVDNRQPVVKAICLHVTHDCNLKCKYCFAEEGQYKTDHRSLMSFEVGKKALDFVIKNSGGRKNLEVDFFGGEPLMNFDVVKKLVEYGREEEKKYNKNFRFTITTNGILLNSENEKFINENMHNVVLSLDGRKEVNDKMRPKSGGQGSYDNIVPKFQSLVKNRGSKDYYVRGTFTRDNLDFSEDVMHMAELGFKQLSVEPVVGLETEKYSIRKEDLEKIYNEYENLALKLIEEKNNGNYFNFFHFMIDLTGGPCVAKRLVGCGAGTEYIAVTPDGDLYPCHQFVGQEEFKMGNLDTGIITKDLQKDFEMCNVYAKDECKNCWAKFYCSGGCISNAYNFNQDILKPYEIGCSLQKKRIECALMMKIDEAFNN